MARQSDQEKADYRTRLKATVDTCRILLLQGLPFRGHDESEESSNRGNFLEFLQFVADQNEEASKVILKNAPGNHKMIAPHIQKDVINACAVETTNVIVNDVKDELFSILVDESRDVSVKEQMAIVLRYVDKKGFVIEQMLWEHLASVERFFGRNKLNKSENNFIIVCLLPAEV